MVYATLQSISESIIMSIDAKLTNITDNIFPHCILQSKMLQPILVNEEKVLWSKRYAEIAI